MSKHLKYVYTLFTGHFFLNLFHPLVLEKRGLVTGKLSTAYSQEKKKSKYQHITDDKSNLILFFVKVKKSIAFNI